MHSIIPTGNTPIARPSIEQLTITLWEYRGMITTSVRYFRMDYAALSEMLHYCHGGDSNFTEKKSRQKRHFHIDYLTLRDLLERQSEDYNYYAFLPSRINAELMVGAMDGNGNRAPRSNCVFYVNQQNVDPSDPNYARTRAIQFAALMNAAYPGDDYVHALRFLIDNGILLTGCFSNSTPFGVRRYRRPVPLRYREPKQTQLVPRHISVVRAAMLRQALPNHRRGAPGGSNQPPGATPPRDGDQSEIDKCAQVDPAKEAAKWAKVPEVSGDISPFKGGGIRGRRPFGDPNLEYSVEIMLFDNGAAQRTNTPVDMKSKLDIIFSVDVIQGGDYLKFKLGDKERRSDDGSCSVGGWDHFSDRQMDCGFLCVWNGPDPFTLNIRCV
ncbi:hypothetical protein C8J57DRAFT_1225950 [Mycena rebaudengoi]|nr:hypothetical protein C8J57DRAFT_1225950 [Mycena rebaudengoi]